MSYSPIESVKAVFPGELLNRMAGILGESNSSVQQAMQGIIPSIVTGIILKTEFGDAHDAFNLSKEAAKIEIPFNQTSLAWWWNSNYKGHDYLKSLFGEKASNLTDAIASYAGISGKSASSLLNVVAPAAYSVLGKHILETNMNVSGLRIFLDGEKKKTLNLLPAGVFMEGIMGTENLSGLSEKFARIKTPLAPRKSGGNLVLPAIILVVAVMAFWYFFIKQRTVEAPPYSVLPKTVTTKGPPPKVFVGESRFSVKLPTGKLLYVQKGGIEDQLIGFFNDPRSRPSRRFPFNFDQLTFNEGSAVITNESIVQIQNIAMILKAYPRAKIKIGGFNEKGGDSVLKSSISQNRAASVAKALKALGINPNQIAGVEGFGSGYAKYEAEAADSLKEQDDRISISIRAK